MPQPVTTSSRRRPERRPALPIAIAAIAIVAAAVAFLLRKGGAGALGEPPPPAAGPAKAAPSAAPVEPRDTPARAPASVEPAPQAPPPVSPHEARISAATNNYVKKPGQMLTDDGRVLTFPPPKEGEFRTVHSHGKVYKCDSEGNWEDVTPRPLFDNSFEENLVGLSIEGGTFTPGMLMGLDNDSVRKMLEKPVIINENDSKDVIAKKEAVAEMKTIILEYLDDGGKFDNFVMEIYSLSAQERTLRGKGLKRISRLLNEGRLEDARVYLDTYNAVLAEQGMSPLKLPRRFTEMLGEARVGN